MLLLQNAMQSWVYFVLQQMWKLRSLPADSLGTLSEGSHSKRMYPKTSEDLHYDCLRATQASRLRQLKGHGCVQPMQSAAQGDIHSSPKELDVSCHGNDEVKQK